MTLPDALERLCDTRRAFGVELVIQARHRRHALYRTDPTVTFIDARKAHARLGNGYREVLGLLFECIDSRYSPAEGFTKAYRLRPLALEVVTAWTRYLPGPRPPTAGEADVYCPVVRLDRLREYAGLDTEDARKHCAYTRALLRGAEPIGPGLGVLYERYAKYGIGRRFVSGIGLQHGPKRVRRLALSGLGYSLVDVSNAHPNILNQLTGGRYPALRLYCEAREGVLHEVGHHYGCNRDEAKELLLMLGYGAALSGPTITAWLQCSDNPWKHAPFVRAYQRDFAEAGKEVLSRHPGLRGNPRSRLSLVLQSHEDAILVACEAYHRARGEVVVLLLFDGYVVLARPDLQDLSAWVAIRTGFELQFTSEGLGAESALVGELRA